MSQIRRHPQRLLLDSHAFTQDMEQGSSMSGGIVFGEDTPSHPSVIANDYSQNPINRGWSEDDSSGFGVPDTTSSSESDIFAGGETNGDNSAPGQAAPETHVCALYIQMSMYPMTLAQFISPSSGTGLRHCFHLAPTLRLILSIHEGLQYVHSKGLIHRDIKPGNIFLSSPSATFEGGSCDLSCLLCAEVNEETSPATMWLNPRIGDFGLVHQLAQGEVPASPQSSPNPRNDAGTAYYQPPGKSEKKDEKIDIFALGVVLVEMICRCNTAMERVDMLKGLQRGELPAKLRADIRDEGHESETAERVVELVSSMLDEDPERRWSGSRVREALLDLLGRCRG